MTLHISLPNELENMVHREVESGMYGSASEVVREALRKFFSINSELSETELAWIREEIKKRRNRMDRGDENWVDGKDFFAHMEKKYS